MNRIHAYLIFANCLIIGLFTNADAQRIIGTFSGKKNYIPHYTKWFLSGDSLLVTFEDRRSLAENTQAFFYISASKTSNISELKKGLTPFFCGFENYGLTTYQYILEIGKKDTMSIKALVIGDDPKESFVSHERITIKDELVGINNSNGIEVITRNNKNNTLGIFHIRGLRIMDHVEYALPPRFAFINSKDIRLVGRNAIGWVESANTRAKIYLEPDQLIFTLDHQSATDILFLGAKSKKERVLIVPEKTDPNCNSFLIDSTLLRLSVFDNYFTIKSYSLRDGSLKSKVTYSLDQASADTKKLEGIIKNDATVKEKFKELTRSTKYGAVPFIIGNGNDTRTYFVTVGSYRFDNRIRYSGIGTPIIELFNYGYGALANQLDDAPLNKPTINNYLGGVYAVDKVDFTLKANPFFQKVNELLKSKEFLFISASEPHDSKIYLLAKRLKTNELVVFEIRE